jgi:hypothetical protein
MVSVKVQSPKRWLLVQLHQLPPQPSRLTSCDCCQRASSYWVYIHCRVGACWHRLVGK